MNFSSVSPLLTVIDRGYFFEGVFDKLQGMTYMPDRKFHLAVRLGRSLYFALRSHRHIQGGGNFRFPSLKFLIDIQPYIPHIAMMYAAGLQNAETIFCGVRIHHIVLARKVDSHFVREK